MKNKVNKIIAIIALITAIVVGGLLTSCINASNKTIFDTTYSFDTVQISMPDGKIIKGTVETWHDWENGDAVQVKVDGVTYYTHLSNVVLMCTKN